MVALGDRILTFREGHCHLEYSSLPDCLFLAWNATLPDLEVEDAISAFNRPRPEAERMIFPPLLPGTTR